MVLKIPFPIWLIKILSHEQYLREREGKSRAKRSVSGASDDGTISTPEGHNAATKNWVLVI